MSEDNCKMIQETFKFRDLVRLILEVLRILESQQTPHNSPSGGVYREDFGENWPRYNGTALYVQPNINDMLYDVSLILST